jgi:hypothetical protein
MTLFRLATTVVAAFATALVVATVTTIKGAAFGTVTVATVLRTITKVAALRAIATTALAITGLVFAAFATFGAVWATKTTVLRTVTKVTTLRTLIAAAFKAITATTFVVAWTEFTALATFGALKTALVRTAKTGRTWTVAKVTAALRTVITAVVTGTKTRGARHRDHHHALAIGAETAVDRRQSGARRLRQSGHRDQRGDARSSRCEKPPRRSPSSRAGRPPSGRPKPEARGARRAHAEGVRHARHAGPRCAGRDRSRLRAGATGCRRLFRLGWLGRCTQNRARRRGIGGRGGIASTRGAGLFRRFD